ncbi:TetR family transcriptional regulator [Leucobacter luti]|uniref:TetR/AcrR family transcriptional regulator n=1 Tax=Leucobacter luti TaxID=340320 RepID=UPI0010527C85|nr:TetR family transcriptional regulator C-terminal domain-containing protein [Leucobacter luti]MCW2287670.1 AcrR family transcriptional regulator [Leucobacter luti]TCK46165.1 TetR family transcriptional regulator [Leucobacter luti]
MVAPLDRDARKAHLAEAVWRVVLTRGISAVSVRTVAEEAGVAVGSLRHLFPTRSELVQFSAELMLQRATERIQATPLRDDLDEYVLDVIAQLLPLSPDSRAELEINLALMAEAVAVPELVAIRNETQAQLAGLALRMVELVSGRSRETADLMLAGRRLHALIDGLAIQLLHQPEGADPQWALEILRAEVAGVHSGARSVSSE